MSKVITTVTSVDYCDQCPFHKVLPDPDPDDWFNDDDVKIVCVKENKNIDVALRPHHVKNTEIPDWCPLP